MSIVSVISRTALTLASAAILVVPVGACTPGSNNGTLKVHEQGTASNTESNDPKVCTFNLEGYGFDKGQDGIIVITRQGGGNEKTEVKRLAMPAAQQSEQHTTFTATTYLTLSDGQYKSTVYGKDRHGEYTIDLKAKSKVFKVACAPKPTPQPATIRPATPATTSEKSATHASSTTTPSAVASTTTNAGHTSSTATTVPQRATSSASVISPTVLPATGSHPLQPLLNTLCAGIGAYSALMLRRKQ